MSAATGSIFAAIPETLDAERFEQLVSAKTVRIERILSQGHMSPESGWYDQDESEWVVVLRGRGRLQFDDGEEVELGAGDWIDIPAHRKHRVAWTDPAVVTVWLAVFYGGSS